MSARTKGEYMSARCYDCGRVVRCYTPAAGDGSVEVYSLHKRPDGKHCAGSKAEVEPEDMVTGASR